MAAPTVPPVLPPIRTLAVTFSLFLFQVTVSQVQEIRDITRIERIGAHVLFWRNGRSCTVILPAAVFCRCTFAHTRTRAGRCIAA